MKTFTEDKHPYVIYEDLSQRSAGSLPQSYSSPASGQKFFTNLNSSRGHSDTSLEGDECPSQGDVFELRCPDDQGNGTCLLFGIHGPSFHPPRHLATPSCFPDITLSATASEPTLFEMPVESVPEMGLGCPWFPTGEELCDAAACMTSRCKEEQRGEGVFVKEETSGEPVCQTRIEKCQPTLDHMGENLAMKGPDMCQVRCSVCGAVMLVNNTKLVQMNNMQCVLPGQVLNASEQQVPSASHRGPPELSDTHEKETFILGQMVSSTPAGSHPTMVLPGPASPSLPFIQAAPTFPTVTCDVPPETLKKGWSSNSLPEPCISQFSQTACNVFPDSKGLLTETQPKIPLERNQHSGTYWDSGERKACQCMKSQCLKFYCDCFANGELCIRCNCANCYNNMEHAHERYKAIKICLERNPDAFQPKIGNRKWGKVKGRHNMGCSCKRSGCMKNYCECYEANTICSSTCKCVGCKNYEEGFKKTKGVYARCKNDNILSYKGAQYQYSKCPLACITSDVVEATCGCLIACAEEAEKEGYTPPQAEKMILREFGQCLTQIIRSIFKPRTLQDMYLEEIPHSEGSIEPEILLFSVVHVNKRRGETPEATDGSARQHTNTPLGEMKKRTTLMCTCTIIWIFLAVVSCTGTKQNKLNAKNWGPQSMMYLKGKCKAVNGRRFAQDYEEDNVYKSVLNNWSSLLKGFQHLKPVGVRKIRGLMASENFVFHYLR